uniref:Uncharacterized protein n=2 Tax=Cannabis sativa TaxID=3483 RepID=A0A803PW96_CANSA
MALKASGAYKHCNPYTGSATVQGRVRNNVESDADSDRFQWSYRRTGSSSSTTPKTWGKEMELRLKGISSSSGRRVEPPIVFVVQVESHSYPKVGEEAKDSASLHGSFFSSPPFLLVRTWQP